MRPSAGFCEIGLSGKMRIQIRPPRLMWRVIARRAASIWRAVRRPRPSAFRPNSPKLTRLPRVATPLLRPFCSLRYLRLAGCSILLRSRPAWATLRRRCLGRRFRSHRTDGTLALADGLALEYPYLDADDAVRRFGLGEAVIDVRSQRVQGH